MATRTKGAVRTVLGTVATTATVVDLAMQIVETNLRVMLEEELYEAELTRQELAVKRASLAPTATEA